MRICKLLKFIVSTAFRSNDSLFLKIIHIMFIKNSKCKWNNQILINAQLGKENFGRKIFRESRADKPF